MKRTFKISSHGGWTLALAVLAMLAVMFAAPLQAGAVNYYMINDSGTTLPNSGGVTTNFASADCTGNTTNSTNYSGNNYWYYVMTSTSTTNRCYSGAIREEDTTSVATQNFMLWVSDTPYSVAKTVTGGSMYVDLRCRNCTTPADFEFTLGYLAAGSNVFVPLSVTPATQTPTGTQSPYIIDLSGMSGDVPANGHLALRIRKLNSSGDTGQFRFYNGYTTTSEGAYFTVTEVDACSATAPSDLAGSDAPGAPVEVDLTWTYDGINNNYYTVYRDGSPIATNIITGSYTDSTVSPSITYDYTVRGYNTGEGCESGDSNPANVTTNACSDDVSTITIDPPTSGATVSGIYAITATVTGEVTAPNDYTSMSVTTSGSACDVTDAAMTDQGGGVWTYSWDTTACGTSVAETGITIDAQGTDPDCGTTRNAAQITGIIVDNTCQETASVYLSQVGSTSGLIQQPIRGTVTVSAALLGTGGSNPRVSTDGITWYAVPYSYSPPVSSSGTVTFFVNATGNCGEITGAYDPTSVDYNTLPNDYAIATCSECHYEPPTDGASRGNPSGATVGSHFAHDRAGFACTDCHVNNTDTDHREGLIEMSGYGANYTNGTSFAQWNNVSGTALGTCTNLNCHGASTPTWGDYSRVDGDCAICHGMSDSGKTGRDTAGNVATNDPQVGAHATHLNSSNNLSDDVDCTECHTPPLGADYLAKVVEGSGHNDTALPAELNWGPTAVTNGLGPNFITGTRVCNNTWCHGTHLGEGDQTPAWDNDSLLTGSNADCQACHDHPVLGGGSLIKAHQTAAYTSALSGDRCRTCHPDMNNSNDYLFDVTDNHVDGKVDAWTCISCHNVDQPDSGGANRRTVTGASGDIGTTSAQGLASHHIQPDASGVQDDTCLACHYQDMPKLTDGVNVRLYNPDSGSIITYDGTGASVEDFCNNCHDSGGATRLSSPTQPFSSSGDTTTPPATGWKKTLSVHKDVDIGSDSSKEKCMGCHGKAGAGGGTLDPAQNAHGSGQTKLMRYTYAGTESVTNANNVCYNCHGNTAANGAVDEIKDQFDLTGGRHSTITCLDCHNVHKAEAGNHTTGSNLAPGVLNSMVGNTPTFSGTNWAGASSFTSQTVTYEYELCINCHATTGTTVVIRGSGSTSHTNVALEFNPNNLSRHPIVTPLPTTSGDARRGLAAGALTGGWSPGDVMTCSDCHRTDVAGKYGPHGSSVKWMLNPNTTGTKYYNWPYTSTANNGSNSTTGFIMGTGSNTVPTNNFCFSCHVWSGGAAAHTGRSDHGVACVSCHIRVPHGSKTVRLLTGPNAPNRYWPNGNGGGTVEINGANKPNSGTMGENDCNTTGSSCGNQHQNGSAVTW